MALNPSNSSNLEQLALKGLIWDSTDGPCMGLNASSVDRPSSTIISEAFNVSPQGF